MYFFSEKVLRKRLRQIIRRLEVVVLAVASLGATQAFSDDHGDYRIEFLSDCPAFESDPSEFVLYDGRTNLLQGWSHVSTDETFKRLKRPVSAYAVDRGNWQSSQECGAEKVFSAILVKKLGNWDGSHANGIEPLFERAPIALGDIEAVILELKLDSEKTTLPDRAALHQHFAFAATPEQLNALDQQQYNLGITLFEKGFRDQNSATLNAQTRVAFNPDTQSDQWLRVTIPIAKMHTYLEQHYAPRDIVLGDYVSTPIIGLRINPETHSGKVVRNINGLPWQGGDAQAVAKNELFKEMAIKLRKVALRIKTRKEATLR